MRMSRGGYLYGIREHSLRCHGRLFDEIFQVDTDLCTHIGARSSQVFAVFGDTVAGLSGVASGHLNKN